MDKLGEVRGFIPASLVDENGTSYGVKHTSNEIHTLTKLTDGTNDGSINSDGQLHVVQRGKVCTENSTIVPLSADGTFTGTSVETLDFAILLILVKSDVASATDGLSVQFSSDGTNWDSTDEFTVPANTGKTFSFQTVGRYFRVVYTNGGSDQTYFRLQTLCKKTYTKPSSHRIQDAIIDDDDAELVKAVLTGKNAAGNFINFQATAAGNFKTSIEELESGVSSNSNSQLNVTPFHSDGTEGALITGVDYASGKSGVDASTETIQTIDYAHHEIHAGSNFFCGSYVDLTNAQVYDILIVTPNTTKWAHMLFKIATEAEANFILYEGTATSDNGTELNCFNRNRNSVTTATTTLYHTPTVTTVGTVLGSGKMGSGRQVGGEIRDVNEMVLKQNTKYLFRITNDTATANWMDYEFDWYEHTDKN